MALPGKLPRFANNITLKVGLCHVSELPEDHADNIEAKYIAGEKGKAKVLKVDEDKHQISLGMKKSYFGEDSDIQMPLDRRSADGIEENDHVLGNRLTMFPLSNSAGFEEVDVQYENGKHPILAEVESRASILPLEVPLDETENSAMYTACCQSQEDVDDKGDIGGKDNTHTKRKEKEEREREIRAFEERLPERDIPRTADDFEKLVRSSPNSSFIWIKYMAFMLSSTDVEKARSIAERALNTISIREESEKLNVWVAYFNLENEYGDPPNEAVENKFKRALRYCDTKKGASGTVGNVREDGAIQVS